MFPNYKTKIKFSSDFEDVNLFVFNPTIKVGDAYFYEPCIFYSQHCAEGVFLEEGQTSYLFSVYTKTLVTGKCDYVD